ncbi:response regulator transcription factor [Clostridium grantii]|uniref:Stage 0 sporulation protein A homolog n=1 Tax=Clostridium grantii DSM 8605 TaxID=1121316 RepID=A0A1M5T0V9_9CLOT|nr:response regulator transcription factor [Clostridium grantii]SHH44431.1 DNA-binding response regulator, OmpR family, contains REC and winged-helix (wHTH) domain [Clostridium grantii DSM 8605]
MKIIIIDDEEKIRRILGDYLKNEGFEIIEGKDGMDGLEKIMTHNDIDLILLDIRMPGMDGFETIKEIRKVSPSPVIFLTALNQTHDEVKGLQLGADDYISKPFTYEILVARVHACLRRFQKSKPKILEIYDLKIDFTNREVISNKETLNLTQKEFEMLDFLIYNKNIPIKRDVILDRIWGYDYYGDPRTVDTHIKTLRAKLGKYSDIIKTVRGVGYKLEIPEN